MLNNILRHENDYFKKMFFVLGIFSTLTALIVDLQVIDISLFNLLLIAIVCTKWLLVLYKIFKCKKKYKFENYNYFFIFIIIALISGIINIFILPTLAWKYVVVKYLINFVFIYASFYFLFSKSEKNNYVTPFIRGVQISCYIQLIWEYMQLFVWKIFNVSINEIFFNDLLGYTNIDYSGTLSGKFRPAGFGWEPAYLSMSLIVGYILSKKIWQKLLFGIGVFLSSSRTGIIVFLVILLIDIYNNRDYLINLITSFRLSDIKNYQIIMLAAVIFTIFVLRNQIFAFIYNEVISVILRIIHFNSDPSGMTHASYYIDAIPILFRSGPLRMLFGYGIGASGLPYTIFNNFYPEMASWSIESDFIGILMCTGVLGFVSYYLWLLKTLLTNKNNKYQTIMVAIIIAGIFYTYFSTWVIVFEILISANYKNIYIERKKYKL